MISISILLCMTPAGISFISATPFKERSVMWAMMDKSKTFQDEEEGFCAPKQDDSDEGSCGDGRPPLGEMSKLQYSPDNYKLFLRPFEDESQKKNNASEILGVVEKSETVVKVVHERVVNWRLLDFIILTFGIIGLLVFCVVINHKMHLAENLAIDLKSINEDFLKQSHC